MGVPVPQLMESTVDVMLSTPQECVQSRTSEQIVDSLVPLFMGADVEIMPSLPLERVQNRTPEQIMDFPAPLNMEVYAGRVRAPPQERVQNRILEPVMDVPMPHIKQGAVSTGNVFTVKLSSLIIVMTMLARTMWGSSRVWTSTTCLDLEM